MLINVHETPYETPIGSGLIAPNSFMFHQKRNIRKIVSEQTAPEKTYFGPVSSHLT